MIDKEVMKIFKRLNIPSNIIYGLDELIDNGYLDIVTNDKDLLKFKFYRDLLDDLVDCMKYDIYESIYYTVDIIYKNADIYNCTEREKNDVIRLLKYNSFDVENYEYRIGVITYLLWAINEYKYYQYTSIQSITEAIPIPIFMNIYNNQSEEKYKVYMNTEYGKVAGELVELEEYNTMFGTIYYANIAIISRSKEYYVKKPYRTNINPNNNLIKSLEDLNIYLITDDIYKELTERGRKYFETTKDPKYCYYSGVSFFPNALGGYTINNITSRVMIDAGAFNWFNLDIDHAWSNDIFLVNDKDYYGLEVKEEDYWQCSPIIYGFSFNNKQWKKLLIDNISEIEYSTNAFNELILDSSIKNILMATINNDIPSLDAIEGKGAGKIFLLYGPPGVGKTYSAEAIAEVLKKPLYNLSVGELGITPRELENSLENAMKIVERWDAILLLDEVDVFAVDRKDSSIERNAMTAILLRVLEKYNGIMFMTTNLIDNLDPAFISRATAVIKYEELSIIAMFEIWSNLIDKIKQLNTINISSTLKDDIKELYDKHAFLIYLNGRTIKNILRLAYALALENKEELSIKQIEVAVSGLAKRGAY